MCGLPMREHWRNLANTIELVLVLPSANPSPQLKRQIDRFSHFCTVHSRVSSGMRRHALFPNNCPLAWGWAPSNICFLGPVRVNNPNGTSIGSAVFAQFTSECRWELENVEACRSPQNSPFPCGICTSI